MSDVFLRIVQKIAFAIYFSLNKFGIFRFVLVEKSFIRAYFWYKSKLENFNLDSISHLVRPNSTVIDVGANVGWFTVAISRYLSPDGIVIAVEPNKVNLKRLVRAIELFSVACSVRIEDCALSSNRGDGFLTIDPSNPANHRISTDPKKAEKVELKLLDDLTVGMLDVSLIKIDIQGHEINALQGSRDTLRRHKPSVVIEIDNDFGVKNTELIFDFMKTMSYEIFFVEDLVTSISKDQLCKRKGYFDCICLPCA
jgi:FkbM family methyltransferase